MSDIFKDFTGYNSTLGLIASISLDISTAFDALVTQVTSDILSASEAPVSSVVPVTSFAAIAKATSKVFKSKLSLFFHFVIQLYKLLKLCISLEFKKRKIFSRDSKCIRCIFGYYRSKYLRRTFHQDFRVTEFDFSVHNTFFTVNGGAI